MNDWKTKELTKTYLEGVRGAIPLAKTQLELILRIVKSWNPGLGSFLDLGCGDGIIGRSLFEFWPNSEGVFLDFSEPMMKEARAKSSRFLTNSTFLIQDYSDTDWIKSIQNMIPFDLVVSGFSIHHLEDNAKIKVYNDVFEILKPGGLFLNLEHVASRNSKIEKIHDELFIHNIISSHQHNSRKTVDEITAEYYNRDDKGLNKLTLVETQCDWLREIGFSNVDCYFKIFELALFGGTKP